MKSAGEGQSAEARKHYQEALRLDPGMGRAQSGLAVLESIAGHHAEADRWFQAAMSNLGRMSDREKLRTRGIYYGFKRDADAAVTANEALVKDFPADNAAWANLAVAYQLKRDFPDAVKASRRAIEIYPRNVPQTNNVGLFEMYAGNADEAVRVQQRVIEIEPTVHERPDRPGARPVPGRQAGRRGRNLEPPPGDRLRPPPPRGWPTWPSTTAGSPRPAPSSRRRSQADLAAGDGDSAARKLTALASVQRPHRPAEEGDRRRPSRRSRRASSPTWSSPPAGRSPSPGT